LNLKFRNPLHGLVGLLALLPLLLLSMAAHAINPEDLLEPEKAFRLSARAVAPDAIEVRYVIADGYYMYRERFKFAADPDSVKFGTADFPKGEVHQDAFFGRTETYRKAVAIRIPVLPSQVGSAGADKFKLIVTSQGCADAGICYPPQKQTVSVDMLASSAPSSGAGSGFGKGGALGLEPADLAGDSDIAAMFESGGFWIVMASFFGFGLLLAFTPCMLPMLPILSGIIVGEGRDMGKLRALILSLAYVLGMAITYALAGVAAAYSGTLLAAALQNPWVLGVFALVFVWLALSMFGFHDIQLPAFLHHRLHSAHHKLQGGQVASVALMGVLSAIVVSPCVAAPLAGAILYISQSRDVVVGGSALFVMALGMGVPLIIVGVSEGALLPKSGPWMKAVKQFFGFLLLGVAIWIISPVVPAVMQMLGWAALLITMAMFLRAIDPLPHDAPGLARVLKGAGLIALLAGAAMIVGMLAGSRDPLRPLGGLYGASADVGGPAVKFERVKTVAELDARVKAAGQPVMLDFYADWCVSCKEMERWTFPDAAVKTRLGNILLLQADVTANNDDDRALLKRFRLFGPPGIIFFDQKGRELERIRVIGYQPAEKFAKVLDAVLATGQSATTADLLGAPAVNRPSI
jgi:thiol:disulfide interchange protein DsbD